MIRRLLVLNGLAVLGVVLYHATGWGFIAMFWWTHRYMPVSVPNFDQMGNPAYYSLRFIEQLITYSIPAFLVVSGYFITVATKRSERTVSWRVVAVRILYLAIPYLLWSFIIIFGDVLQGTRYNLDQIGRMMVTGKAAPAFYFVPLLIQLLLLSPLLVLWSRRNWKVLLLVAALIQIAVKILIYTQMIGPIPPALQPFMFVTQSWLFPGNLFWFVLGITIGFNLQALKEVLARFRWLLAAATVVLLPLGVLEWELILRWSGEEWLASRETLLDNVYSLAFVLVFLAFDKVVIPRSKEVGELGARSFGIYLVHSPVLEFTARATYAFVPWLLAHQILFQPLLIAMGIGVPLLLMAAVNLKWSPIRAYYRYVFG
jgi:peptidoglycan/LPS O-acetylase OafA/YrhL